MVTTSEKRFDSHLTKFPVDVFSASSKTDKDFLLFLRDLVEQPVGDAFVAEVVGI